MDLVGIPSDNEDDVNGIENSVAALENENVDIDDTFLTTVPVDQDTQSKLAEIYELVNERVWHDHYEMFIRCRRNRDRN